MSQSGFASWGALFLSLFVATCVQSQSVEPSLAIGVAAPRGSLAENRSAGPLLRGGVTLGDRQRRRVRLRFDVEGAWMPGRGADAPGGGSNRGTLRSVGGLASVLVGARGSTKFAPYGLVGFGLERLSVTGVNNPYGTTAALRAGFGVQWRMRTRTMLVEIASHAALTDFATGAEFDTGVRVPIAMGVRF